MRTPQFQPFANEALPHASRRAGVRFGLYNAISRTLETADFIVPGLSTVAQNKGIYGTVIGSRLVEARSNNERREVAVRNTYSWYNWFMGSQLLQIGMAMLMGLMLKNRLLLLTRYNVSQMSLPKKILNVLFAPEKLWRLARDSQIEQRRDQIIKAIDTAKRTNPDMAVPSKAEVEKLFNDNASWRSVISALGMIINCITLGIGMNYLLIFLTRSNVNKKIERGLITRPATLANESQSQAAASKRNALANQFNSKNTFFNPANQNAAWQQPTRYRNVAFSGKQT